MRLNRTGHRIQSDTAHHTPCQCVHYDGSFTSLPIDFHIIQNESQWLGTVEKYIKIPETQQHGLQTASCYRICRKWATIMVRNLGVGTPTRGRKIKMRGLEIINRIGTRKNISPITNSVYFLRISSHVSLSLSYWMILLLLASRK